MPLISSSCNVLFSNFDLLLVAEKRRKGAWILLSFNTLFQPLTGCWFFVRVLFFSFVLLHAAI